MGAPIGNKNALGHGKGRPAKYTEDWLAEEAKSLREWIDDDTHFHLNGFAFEHGYDPSRYQEFQERSVDFAQAFKYAKYKQQERFMLKSLSKEWDGGFARYAMARVCGPEWKASWDREESIEAHPTTVIINKIEK